MDQTASRDASHGGRGNQENGTDVQGLLCVRLRHFALEAHDLAARASSGRGQGKHAAGPRTTSSPNRAVATGERSGPATLAHRTRLDP
jgi:hypothetical protein